MSVALYPLASKGSANQLDFVLFSNLSPHHSACRGRPINVFNQLGELDQVPNLLGCLIGLIRLGGQCSGYYYRSTISFSEVTYSFR